MVPDCVFDRTSSFSRYTRCTSGDMLVTAPNFKSRLDLLTPTMATTTTTTTTTKAAYNQYFRADRVSSLTLEGLLPFVVHEAKRLQRHLLSLGLGSCPVHVRGASDEPALKLSALQACTEHCKPWIDALGDAHRTHKVADLQVTYASTTAAHRSTVTTRSPNSTTHSPVQQTTASTVTALLSG